jgi:hypothetical protein
MGVINRVLVDLGVLNELDKVSPGVVGGSEKVENGIGVGGGVRSCTCRTGVISRIRDLAKRGSDDALKGMLLLRETLHPDGDFGLVLQ